MKAENRDKPLRERIRAGEVGRGDVNRRLAELAYGKANDCVRLVMEDNPCLDRLDLSLLSEIRRSDKGVVEVRLIDRLQILKQLAALTEENQEEAAAFLQALRDGGEA